VGLYDQTEKGPLPDKRGTAGEGEGAKGFLESEGTRVYHGVQGNISMLKHTKRNLARNLAKPTLTDRRFEHDIHSP